MTIALTKTSSSILQRYDATWNDYVQARDNLNWRKIAFHQGWLWVEMGAEGPNHARFSDLITATFFVWAFLHPEQTFESFGRCLLEHPEFQACAPDLVLYRGEQIPRWQSGEARRIDLSGDGLRPTGGHRCPDLVGEIADTSLAIDLDQQKQLYASLGVAEYWVIDVKATRLFAFGLSGTGVYKEITVSQVLTGLPIPLLEQTLERLTQETNTAAANWFMQQLQALG